MLYALADAGWSLVCNTALKGNGLISFSTAVPNRLNKLYDFFLRVLLST